MSHRYDTLRNTLLGVLGGTTVVVLLNQGGLAPLADARASAPAASAPAGETVEDRIRPVGRVRIKGQVPAEEPAKPAAAAAERSGADVYNTACAACHATGAAGAPKLGDKDAWAPRIQQGFDTLVTHAIAGFKAMPARGGNPTLTDTEVKRAIAHMVEPVGLKVTVPDAPAPAAAAAPGAAAPTAPSPQPAAAAPAPTPAGAAAAVSAAQAAPAGAASPPPAAAADLARGENIYKQACSACHQMGVAGAPKLGDKEAWAPRLAQGIDTLRQHALQGIRGMPPKGGRADLADEVVLDAVGYMVQQGS